MSNKSDDFFSFDSKEPEESTMDKTTNLGDFFEPEQTGKFQIPEEFREEKKSPIPRKSRSSRQERESGGKSRERNRRSLNLEEETPTEMSHRHERRHRRSSKSSGKPKENTFFGGVAILSLGIMVVKLIGMFYKIPLGNIIGEQGNADFSNAYNIYAVLLTISTTGLPVAVSKMISEANTLNHEAQVKRIFRVSLKFFLTLGIISFFIMYFGADFLAGVLRNSHAAAGIRALAPAVIFVSGVAAFRGYFQGRGEMSPTAISQIIEALSKLVLGLALAYTIMNMNFTVEDLLKFDSAVDITTMTEEEINVAVESVQASRAAAAAISGVTVGTALALGFLFLRYVVSGLQSSGSNRRERLDEHQQTEGDIMRTLLAIAIPITITSSMASIINVLDSALVQGQLQDALGYTENESRTAYGNYAFAVNVYNLPLSLMSAVTVSVIPTVTAALAKRERKRAGVISVSALRVTGLLAIPMGFGLFSMGTPIMNLLYPTSDVELAGKLLSTLGIAACFVCLSLVSTSILQVYGFFHLPIVITVVGGVIKLITNYILVGNPEVGVSGAPIGTLACFAFCFCVTFYLLCRIVPGLQKEKFMFVKPIFASVVMAGAAWSSYGLLSKTLLNMGMIEEETQLLSRTGSAVATLLAICLAAIIYMILIFALGAVKKEDILMMPKGETLARILPVR